MRLGRILGIDIFVNVSWFFVFALVAWSLASNIGPLHAVELASFPRAVLGVVTAILFFCSVLIHELAHSLLARARGIPVKGITLFIFGGVSMLEREADTAPAEAWISLVGPLASLGLFFVFSLCGGILAQGQDTRLPIHGMPMAWAFAAGYLAFANLLLAGFNLLPAYPLDGGRVLHAVMWRFTNNRTRATTITVLIGRGIAAAFVIFGIADTLLTGLGGGLWLTFIGWFLFQAGEAARVAARLEDALRGHTAAELAVPPGLKFAANLNAADALHQLLEHQINAAPVFIGERLIGIVTLQDLVRVSDPAKTYITAAMTSIEALQSLEGDADAGEVTRILANTAQTMFPVTASNGELIGVITRESLVRWMSKGRPKDSLPV